MTSRLVLALVALCGLAGVACSGGYAQETAAFREAVTRSDLVTARAEIDALIREAEEEEDVLDEEYALLLLERSTVAMAAGDYQVATNDLNTADGLLEVLDLSPDNMDAVGQYLWSDDTGLYRAPMYEKLMVNLVKVALYLELGDFSGARVEARRIGVLASYYDATELADHPALATSYRLAGLAMELSGELDEAMRFYLDAWHREPSAGLADWMVRLAPETTLWRRSEVGEARALVGVDDDAPLARTPQEVVVLVFSGLAPRREAERIPIGLIWGWATSSGLYLDSDYKEPWERIRAEQLLTWINFPVLVAQPQAYTHFEVFAGDQAAVAEPLADFEGFAVAQWEGERGTIALAAITRAIVRVLAREAIQAVGNAASDSDEARTAALIASLIVQGTMQAADVPDTRTWSTMAGRLFVARIAVEPGQQHLEVEGNGPGGRRVDAIEIDVPAGGARVVAVRVVP